MAKSFDENLEQMNELRAEAMAGGGEKKIEKIHASGRLTARERIHLLLDEGSFQETGVFVRHRSHELGMDKNRPVGDEIGRASCRERV